MYKQGFEENSQSSSTLSPVAPKDVNKHLMGVQARADNDSDMDISDGDITCTEFCPRKRKPTSEPIGTGAHPTHPPAMESVKKKLKCFNCGKPEHFLRQC